MNLNPSQMLELAAQLRQSADSIEQSARSLLALFGGNDGPGGRVPSSPIVSIHAQPRRKYRLARTGATPRYILRKQTNEAVIKGALNFLKTKRHGEVFTTKEVRRFLRKQAIRCGNARSVGQLLIHSGFTPARHSDGQARGKWIVGMVHPNRVKSEGNDGGSKSVEVPRVGAVAS